MSPSLFLFLIFLPLPIAVALFVFTSKSPRQGYLLGLIPIFLFWQIVCILFLQEEARNPCQDFCGFFETAAGYFILILIVFYTVLGLSLRRIYRRAASKAPIPRRSIRSMTVVEMPFFLAILFVSILCGLGFYGFTLWSVESSDPSFTPLFFLGYGNYILLKQGIAAFIGMDVLILALFWILFTRFSRKQGEHPSLDNASDFRNGV